MNNFVSYTSCEYRLSDVESLDFYTDMARSTPSLINHASHSSSLYIQDNRTTVREKKILLSRVL